MTAPTLEDTTEVKLCLGLIQLLVGLQLVTWRADAAYSLTLQQPAAYLVTWPSAPDKVATFTPYPVADDPDQAMSTVGVQVRTRWAGENPRAVANYAGAIFDALHGLGPVELAGGVRVSQVLRRSGTSMGQDGSKRWSWADNYYVDLDRPSSYRS